MRGLSRMGEQIYRMLDDGVSHKQISEALGCHVSLPSYYAAKRKGVTYKTSEKRKSEKKSLLERNQDLMIETLRASCCADCSERDILVLEFDHVSGKQANISKIMRKSSWARVQAEMEKCEVVCANCHRRRTHTRQGNYRARAIGKP